jgi:hypothetical protein
MTRPRAAQFASLFLVVGITATAARAENFSLLGRTIEFRPPTGYCSPGKSAVEVNLTERAVERLPRTARLAYWSAPCEHLKALREGRRDRLTEWLQIQVIAPKGQPELMTIGRETFLAGVDRSAPKITPEQVQELQKRTLSDLKIKSHNYQVIGRDGNALYSVMAGELASSTEQFRFRGASALTLINSVPIMVVVYGPHEAAPQKLMAVQRELLTSLLTSN